jgi:serine-type D-Ala-D-Ala carboxypeptidase/endopeptidase (penicillin-binding protein 4)
VAHAGEYQRSAEGQPAKGPDHSNSVAVSLPWRSQSSRPIENSRAYPVLWVHGRHDGWVVSTAGLPRLRATGLVLAMSALAGGLLVANPPSVEASDNRDAQIAASVTRLAGNSALGSNVSVHVQDVTTGANVVQIRADRPMIPASTMKIITAFTALQTMGADHRFTTRVVQGPAARHVILEGGGDPLLSSAQIGVLAQRTARSLRASGVIGQVRVSFDDMRFGAPTAAPGWYAGDMPTYVSAVRSLTIFGSYSSDTGLVATNAFIAQLRARGVDAVLSDRRAAPRGATRIARFRGNTVGSAVTTMLLVSENNIAEVLFRQVARSTGRPATWSGASRAARSVLIEEGLAVTRARLVDGSGLSYSNRLSAGLLTDVLARFLSEPELSAGLAGLPVAGRTGTLRNRFQGVPGRCAIGAVRAKTGSLPPTVSTLAGLTRGTDGRVRAFATLVNDRPSAAAWPSTSAAIDSIAAAVYGCVS